MASLTRKEWMKIKDDLKSVYTFPSFMGTEDAVKIWFDALENYPVEHIKAAIKAWIAGSSKEPTPADIIEKIHRIASGEAVREANVKYWQVRNLDGTIALDTTVDYAAFSWDAGANEVRNWFLTANKSYDSGYTLAGKTVREATI